MTKAQKFKTARLACGILSASFGLVGFFAENWTLTGVALVFALAWLIACIAGVNVWIEDEAERIAPRHRKDAK